MMAKENKAKKPIWKRWWMICIYVFVGIGIIANIVPQNPTTEETKTVDNKPTETLKTDVSTTEKLTDLQKQMKALERVNDCAIICAGVDKDIPAIRNEWYVSCNQIYYNLGIEELEKFITDCANTTTT